MSPARIIATVRSRGGASAAGARTAVHGHSSRSMKGGRSTRRCPAGARARALGRSGVGAPRRRRRPGRAPPPPPRGRAPRGRPRACGAREPSATTYGMPSVASHAGADPVRRLVVDVIGEPQARPRLRRRCAQSVPRWRRPRPARCAAAAPARRRRRPCRGCAARSRATARSPAAERLHEQPRHVPVARRARDGRALQRRVEGERQAFAHGATASATASRGHAASAAAGKGCAQASLKRVDAGLAAELGAQPQPCGAAKRRPARRDRAPGG